MTRGLKTTVGNVLAMGQGRGRDWGGLDAEVRGVSSEDQDT